jgi:hypothetical protein
MHTVAKKWCRIERDKLELSMHTVANNGAGQKETNTNNCRHESQKQRGVVVGRSVLRPPRAGREATVRQTGRFPDGKQDEEDSRERETGRS